MNDSTTHRARYAFVAKEYHDGTPWLALELLGGDPLPALRAGIMGFDLKKGTTLARAKELADLLNKEIVAATFTN